MISSSQRYVESKQSSLPRKKRGKQDEPDFPVQPTTIQVIQTPRGTMNHSYRDFSKVPPKEDYVSPTEIKDMSFSQKVHHILSQKEYEKWISWMPHGRAFKVHVPVLFESQICPLYFGHKRYSSFLRELNNYGYKHISKGVDRNCYYHELMLKDRPHLCQWMPAPKDARRLVADPANEPDLYKISELYPLDGTTTTTDESEPAAKRARMESSSNEPSAVPVPSTVFSMPQTSLSSAVSSSSSSGATSEREMLMALLQARQQQARNHHDNNNNSSSSSWTTTPSNSSPSFPVATTSVASLTSLTPPTQNNNQNNAFATLLASIGGNTQQQPLQQSTNNNQLALLAAQLLLKKKEQEEAATKLALAVGLFGK